ncbi:hypothetical protein HanIR_Chr02g0081181 [Helianthus annuus]|nr:hypothetical protein HanIR_Chr02g0081181 [Helianthus annuus]
MIHIITIRAVNNDSLPGILRIIRDVIIHENNYIFILKATGFQYLICMTYICLQQTKNDTSINLAK